MFHRIFTVYDSKAEAFLPIFTMATQGQAIRSFQDTLDDPNHAFARHPHDYTLFFLGEWNDQNAEFTAEKTPVSLGVAIQYVTNEKPNIEPQPLKEPVNGNVTS